MITIGESITIPRKEIRYYPRYGQGKRIAANITAAN
jgi:hypothetical protein